MTNHEVTSPQHDSFDITLSPELESKYSDLLTGAADALERHFIPDRSTTMVSDAPFGELDNERLTVTHTVSHDVHYGTITITDDTDPVAILMARKSRQNRTWTSPSGAMSDVVLAATLQNHWPFLADHEALDKIIKNTPKSQHDNPYYTNDSTTGKLLTAVEMYACQQSSETMEHVASWDHRDYVSVVPLETAELTIRNKNTPEEGVTEKTILANLTVPYEVDDFPTILECHAVLKPDSSVKLRASYADRTTEMQVPVRVHDLEKVYLEFAGVLVRLVDEQRQAAENDFC